MKRIWSIFILFLLFIQLGYSQKNTFSIWQIGSNDHSDKEFALYENGYKQYRQFFKGDAILYEIGTNNVKTDFPFVLPGPRDNWAGGSSKHIFIRFGIEQLDKNCSAKLIIHFMETHPGSPPSLDISLNDFKTKVQTPRGSSDHYMDDGKSYSKNLSIELEIPSKVLKKGSNLLVIRNGSGSWVVFDDISLTANSPVKVGKSPSNDISISAEAIPALVYGKNEELNQPIIIQTINWGEVQEVDAFVDNRPLGKYKIEHGSGKIEIGIPEAKKEKEVQIKLVSKSGEKCMTQVKTAPIKRWTVYMVQHTHTDIGYTKPQTEILAEHLRYIDYAIDYCELTKDYPDDSKFRWTCEAAWAVREYLQNRPKEQIERFKKYITNGQIEVCGMFFNMAEIVDENSFKTFLEPIREFKKMGIPVVTAMQNDVNGIAWCLADYMPDLGIKYFSMGENGHRALIPFDKPTVYKWESPSGKQTYSFRSDHYMTGNGWGIDRANTPEELAPDVFEYLNNLDKKQYPYDAISVQYSGYSTDNSPPSKRESDLIREWNKKYATPKLRSALFHEFMDYVTTKYDKELPSIRAAYPDWWTDGFGSAARETAASRKTHSDMISIQGMLSMAVLKGQILPEQIKDKIRHIHENLLFYDEHTYGASESISDPACDNSQVQWAEKASYAWEALKNAQILQEVSAGLMQSYIPRGEKPTITFFNTLNWDRSGVVEVYIDHEIIPYGKTFKILDTQGKVINAQPIRSRSEGTYYAIDAENIPSMGYKTFQIVTTNNDSEKLSAVSEKNENQMENSYFKISFDSQTGSVKSLYDKELQLEMVDVDSPWQLGAFVYETLGNRQQMERYTLTDYKREGLKNIQVKPGTNGPIYQSVYIHGKSDGCDEKFGVNIEVRLFHREKRIELNYAVKKSPITDPDGIYVAFPFKLDKAKLFFDVQGGVVSSGENQIEGTASDWNTVQNFVAARNDKAQFIVGSNTIPLFQMGGICTGQYQRKKSYEKPHVYSWVTNNYWTTNFRASQEGELRWSYYLTSSKDVSNSLATRFGWDSRIPIYARVMPEGKQNELPTSYSAFKFNKDNFLMTSATPSIEKGYILINVREMDGNKTPLQIFDGTGKLLEFSVVNAIEETVESGIKEVNFDPFGNKFIKFKL